MQHCRIGDLIMDLTQELVKTVGAEVQNGKFTPAFRHKFQHWWKDALLITHVELIFLKNCIEIGYANTNIIDNVNELLHS